MMMEIFEYIMIGAVAVLLGGVVLPVFLNWLSDIWGWLK